MWAKSGHVKPCSKNPHILLVHIEAVCFCSYWSSKWLMDPPHILSKFKVCEILGSKITWIQYGKKKGNNRNTPSNLHIHHLLAYMTWYNTFNLTIWYISIKYKSKCSSDDVTIEKFSKINKPQSEMKKGFK